MQVSTAPIDVLLGAASAAGVAFEPGDRELLRGSLTQLQYLPDVERERLVDTFRQLLTTPWLPQERRDRLQRIAWTEVGRDSVLAAILPEALVAIDVDRERASLPDVVAFNRRRGRHRWLGQFRPALARN